MRKNDAIQGDKSSLTFTFQGNYEVDAVSVVTAVQCLINVSNEIAKQVYPDVEFRLSIRALSPGSLNFDFVAFAHAAQNLFTSENIAYAKNLIEFLKTSFEMKRFLKDKPPKSKKQDGKNVIIEDQDGNKMTIPMENGVYFLSPAIDRSITGIFETSANFSGIAGLKLTHGKSSVEIPAGEFSVLSAPMDMEGCNKISSEENTIVITRRNEFLYIRKPDLLSNARWVFKADKYITADVEDRDFLESVHTGRQNIVAKMYIIADLRVVMELGEDGLPDENTCKYSVVKVHSVHMPEEGQVNIEE